MLIVRHPPGCFQKWKLSQKREFSSETQHKNTSSEQAQMALPIQFQFGISLISPLLVHELLNFILAHCLANNIYLPVFKNIYISVFYLSVFIYLYLFIYLCIFFLNLLIFFMRATLEINVRLCALMCLSSVILYIHCICLFFYLLFHLNYV